MCFVADTDGRMGGEQVARFPCHSPRNAAGQYEGTAVSHGLISLP